MHGENLINFKVTLEGQTYTGLAPDAIEAATKFIEKVKPSKIPCLIDVEDNDNSEDRDETMEKGIKRIKDMFVFAITATFSIFAYIWLFIVLQD